MASAWCSRGATGSCIGDQYARLRALKQRCEVQIEDNIVSDIDEIASAIDFDSVEDKPKAINPQAGVVDSIKRNVPGAQRLLHLVE